MGNISISQLFILLIMSILIFGDITKVIKKISLLVKNFSFFPFDQKKNRKKGS